MFGFSLIGHAKDWLQCIPNRTIKTWKELEDKFMERYFSNAHFIESNAEISNFIQGESELLFDAWKGLKYYSKGVPIIIGFYGTYDTLH